LRDRAGGASAALFLDDADSTGDTVNLVFERAGDASVGSAQIFLAKDDSLALQVDHNAYRFKVAADHEAMRITADGFVGLGTPTPSASSPPPPRSWRRRTSGSRRRTTA